MRYAWNVEVNVCLVHHHRFMILVMNNNGFLHYFTKYFIINVERIAFMRRTLSRALCRISRCKNSNKSLRSFMSLFNIETLSVFRWTCLNTDHVLRDIKLPWSIWRTEFFVKRIHTDPLRTVRFLSFWTTITSCVISSCPDLSQFGLGIGWAGWKNYACRATSPSSCWATVPSGCWKTFEPNSLVQSWRSEIFGGSRGDMHTFFVWDFSSFQSNNFWNTISWKCFLKNDCIRSSLIECQSFPNCKINIDPIYRVLMFLPCVM